ncbi:hypothetical protein SCHPADRAFT_994525 [Schizopora paradoxa]|uniref:Uncharacterized protein n=1 Tax=Schizopora paradoxa TaxID=27342 RepID=A0A0H2RYP0_9AGAM|nr:hypothetical protein SCHPADRAFT_994525 [Schizopora paradoxa]
MKFSIAALVATVLATAANAQFMIITPSNVVECEPTLLSWSGGVAPYFLVIVDGNNPTTTLENLGQVNGTSLSFIVNFASGTSLGLNLKDSTGAVAQSGAFPVQAGTSTACVGQGVSTSAPAGGSTTAGSTASTTAGGSTTSGATSAGSSTTGTTSHASTTSTSPSSGSTTSSSNAAGPTAHFTELGVAGVVGAVMAALAL